MRRALALPMVALLAAHLAGSAAACGFENPDSVTFQRGILNLAFPKALYVTTAVWQAQSAGLIDDLTKIPGESGRFGFVNTALRLKKLGEGLDAVSSDAVMPSFSVVLIGPMLWSQFRPDGGKLGIFPHAKGPATGDVVVVTDASVIAALAEGRISFQDAQTVGLVRVYGQPDKVTALIDRFNGMVIDQGQSELSH